jgi:hypothetical protein
MRWNPFDYDSDPDAVPHAPRTTPPLTLETASDDEGPTTVYAERLARARLRQRGWQVTKRGWPDFFCVDTQGRVVVVEVKGPSDRLTWYQATILEALQRAGMPCFVAHVRRGGTMGLLRFDAAAWFDRQRTRARIRKREAKRHAP